MCVNAYEERVTIFAYYAYRVHLPSNRKFLVVQKVIKVSIIKH